MVGRILRPGDPRDVQAAQFEIEKEDIFHMKNLYEWMHDYLEHHEWEDTDPVGGDRFEHYYWEKRLQGGTREHRMWWRVKKFPAGGNNYFRWVLLINFRNLHAQKTEIVQQGQKIGTWKGDLTLLIEAYLQLDYQNLWRDHWLLKNFDSLYRNRIWKRQKDRWKKELYKEAYEFASFIKEFLDMKSPKTPSPEPDSTFHPKSGVGATPEEPKRG